ncbi:hypothetical protein BY996DRAFT_6516249 [Phakopsora pachyrhizi]|nr:hypothetical protein BY996DRAFT_6516249 [Phakopsora pachyrhizi]
MNLATDIAARGPSIYQQVSCLAAAAANDYHIKDFALEVLDGLITMPQGAYHRVGP